MTLSPNERLNNLNEALIALLNHLGNNPFIAFFIEPMHYPDVFPTTWKELVDSVFIKDLGMNVRMYRFTRFGYIEALKQSGRSDQPQFREGLGNICRVLKYSLKGRTDFGHVVFQDLVRESGVSEAFAHNALDADLIRHILGRNGAEWDGEHLVRVPIDFGQTPL